VPVQAKPTSSNSLQAYHVTAARAELLPLQVVQRFEIRIRLNAAILNAAKDLLFVIRSKKAKTYPSLRSG
jgi:hypothetical protein